ncbi:MAG: DNA integrity scanning protein DisA nucleotide-binding domain protein [Thermoguttaceae bacterium]
MVTDIERRRRSDVFDVRVSTDIESRWDSGNANRILQSCTNRQCAPAGRSFPASMSVFLLQSSSMIDRTNGQEYNWFRITLNRFCRSCFSHIPMIEPLKLDDQLRKQIGTIRQLRIEVGASAILVFPEMPIDWVLFRRFFSDEYVVVGAMQSDVLEAAKLAGFPTVHLHFGGSTTIYDRISHVILEAVADDLIPHGCRVLVMYSALDQAHLDSISVVNLNEHLDRLSGRDLRQLESRVPLKTLKTVVDLAIDVGWEGREGNPVGTLFVVGDTRKVMALSRPAGFDPVRGYQRKERSLFDPKVREGIKEIAQLDGAIIVSCDGTVEAACRYLESTSTSTISLSLGLGARHWAAAAISRNTSAIAVAVSHSSGTVRIFQNGEVALRIESRQRHPLVWRDIEND